MRYILYKTNVQIYPTYGSAMVQETKDSPYSALDNAKTKRVHYRITALSAAGVFLDGYDISIIAVALTIITLISAFSYVNTALGKGLMAASTTIGMLVGAVLFGYITDLKGRIRRL